MLQGKSGFRSSPDDRKQCFATQPGSGCGGFIRNRPFKGQNRAAACEAHAEAELRDANCGASPGEAAARCALQVPFIPQNESHLSRAFGLQPAEGTHVRVRTAGLRAREAAARSVLTDRFQLETSPQPSGGPARADLRDARLQPSARGRLRAADCFAIEFAAKHLPPKSMAADYPISAMPQVHACNSALFCKGNRFIRKSDNDIINLRR